MKRRRNFWGKDFSYDIIVKVSGDSYQTHQQRFVVHKHVFVKKIVYYISCSGFAPPLINAIGNQRYAGCVKCFRFTSTYEAGCVGADQKTGGDKRRGRN